MIPQIICTLVGSWTDNLDMGTTITLPAVPQVGQVLVIDRQASGNDPPMLVVVKAVGYRSKNSGSPGSQAYEPRVLLKVEPHK